MFGLHSKFCKAPAKRRKILMQHLLLARCCVVLPSMLQCATYVARCCMKFANGQNCCTAQHNVTSLDRVSQHLLHACMRIASTFRARSMITIEPTSLIFSQFFLESTEKCFILKGFNVWPPTQIYLWASRNNFYTKCCIVWPKLKAQAKHGEHWKILHNLIYHGRQLWLSAKGNKSL